MTNLDTKKDKAAQDMIRIIMRDKDLTAAEAVAYAVNEDIYDAIMAVDWASIALSLWGHDEPERKWFQLTPKEITIDLDEKQLLLVDKVMEREEVDFVTAIEYFLIFTMDSLGYHI